MVCNWHAMVPSDVGMSTTSSMVRPSHQASTYSSANPLPVATEPLPVSWNTSSIAETSTTVDATMSSVNRFKASLPSTSFEAPMPSATAAFKASVPSVGNTHARPPSSPRTTSAVDGTPKEKRQRDALYRSSWQSGSQTEHDRQKAAVAAGCPGSTSATGSQLNSVYQARGEAAQNGSPDSDRDDTWRTELMELEGCSFGWKKALCMRQQRAAQLIFDSESSGVSTPIAGATGIKGRLVVASDEEHDLDGRPLNTMDEESQIVATFGNSQGSAGHGTLKESHDATAGFGSQGLDGLSIVEGSSSAGEDATNGRRGSDVLLTEMEGISPGISSGRKGGASSSNTIPKGVAGAEAEASSLSVGLTGTERMQQRHSLPGYKPSLRSASAAAKQDQAKAAQMALMLTPEQQARERQQIRADLAGIDRRALKGPLRDLMQNPNYTGEIPGSLWGSNAAVSTAASGSDSETFDLSGGGAGGGVHDRPQIGTRRRSNSLGSTAITLHYPSPSPPLFPLGRPNGDTANVAQDRFSTLKAQNQTPAQAEYSITMPPPPQPALASKQTHNERKENASSSAATTRKTPPRRQEFRRARSGLTVSPQETFLDYENVEAAILASSAMGRSSGAGNVSVFAPDPPELKNALAGDGLEGQPVPLHIPSRPAAIDDVPASLADVRTVVATAGRVKAGGNMQERDAHANGMGTPKADSDAVLLDDTPSLTGSSSVSSREESMIASPPSDNQASSLLNPSRPSMERFQTLKPGEMPSWRSVRKASLSSDSSLIQIDDEVVADDRLSQGSSAANFLNANSALGRLTSTPDDEDEKPYLNRTHPNAAFPFPAQRGQAGHAPGLAAVNVRNAVRASSREDASAPRFSQFSASSSEEEDKACVSFTAKIMSGSGMLAPPGRRPLAGRRAPGTFGGYGYIPGSADSGLSIPDGQAPSEDSSSSSSDVNIEQNRPLALHGLMSREAINGSKKEKRRTSEAGSQSPEDEGSISPNIRSSAQALSGYRYSPGYKASKPLPPAHRREASVKRGSSERAAASATPEEYESGDETYVAESSARKASAGTKRRRATGGKDKIVVSPPSGRQTKTTAAAASDAPFHGAERTFPTSKSGMSICDYVSPLTKEYCGTEFHRMYDLTRHRETIHAKEEAKAVREKQLTMEQCIVLGKEVDPKTSSATVEWKCEGKNGCGSVFSRKDALLRHKRIRNH
ncbi:hypothetical protein K437DRAFT_157391 [Tilletiaria anomala UBC 951]|uniref:C2H2-type domain-containing protein n=1 Tax=Tilletiaria anomala (strain ATCC 24038 / CBS 436.72 / UBC 951) TaxID=1037660 RepID=A0A066VLU5_TILAU|nr:uncharacterized protein K437DRAFT_157391 [Tilletiaria anomala UBC 951]KDN42717.1 hypothetical protein K437DRAFT_157391 [Tilletiaria anomala UBC 951]